MIMQELFAMSARLSPYWLWGLLALPALPLLAEATTASDPKVFHHLVHPSGETAARLLILAMIATPLSLWLRGWRGPRWLVKNRRYIGVAAFGYAALHTLFYLLDKGSAAAALNDLDRMLIWTGWVAFAIFIPLAATSMDSAVRGLGRWWKPVQRLTYLAALFTLWHWAVLHNWGGTVQALVHFAPLILLTVHRIRLNRTRYAPRPA
jgi:sulfoxide reductase heme-binding subunit YedZ